ncbi:hypothetical protein PanWU01x14_055330 [Parasponia andersonii]|uniref:Uncharacterized protein n=1 Tax=Parasponia andersonii TaxID=3476 RepID=A0A2P5DL29_PARAD|nr:hypothetical protein PanWU01x14_055330 [Parasponia andersonii]
MIGRPNDGKLIGYNVDYLGAIAPIKDGLRGADDAGKAVAYGGKEKGARVVVANCTYENFHPEDGIILANITSVGMKPRINDTLIPKVCFPGNPYNVLPYGSSYKSIT